MTKVLTGVKLAIKRVIGLKESSAGVVAHSYLEIDKHNIDNTFHRFWSTDAYLELTLNGEKLIDEDPGTTNRPFIPMYSDTINTEGFGGKNLKLVQGKDEKWEQKFAFQSASCAYSNGVLYDIAMRKFIHRQHGVEIESLSKKWNRLCWNCFEGNEKLMRCSSCHIALYCNRNCQSRDWKVHKLLHRYQESLKKSA